MQLQPQYSSYFNQLISKFESENQGLKVRWLDVPWSAMESKILTAVSAKTAPDVVNLNPTFASLLATRQAWLDLNTKIQPQAKQQYLPKIWQASTLETKTFGIPWYLTSRITIYNRDILSKAAIKQPPTTYVDLAQIAQVIKQKTGNYAFFVTFVPSDSAEVLESLVQMGVTLVDSQNKAAFDTPAGIAAFKYWVDLYQQDLLPPEVLTQGHRFAVDLYQSGQIALLSSGAEFLETIAKGSPTIAEVSEASPQITGSTNKKNVAVMNLVIPQDTEKPDLAVKFGLFVTNTENQLAFAQAANVLPSTQDALKSYLKILEQNKNITPIQKALKVSAMQLSEAEVLVPALKNLNQLQKIIYENLQAAMLKEKTVEQAVKNAATQWNELT